MEIKLEPRDVRPPMNIACADNDELWEKAKSKVYSRWYRLIAVAELERRGVDKNFIDDLTLTIQTGRS